MLARIERRVGVVSAVAIAAGLYAIVVGARLAYHHGDPTFFITAGQAFYHPSLAPQKLAVSTRFGYDGQYYYRLALDPLTDRHVEYGIAIDNPAYRQERILYPILAHILALGVFAWVPWSMILVNYLAVCWLAFTSVRYAALFSTPPIYGLMIPFFPGVLLALDRDLPDPLAISLMVWALYLLHTRRIAFGACILALAVLARETVIVLAAALLVNSVWRWWRRQSAWIESVLLVIPIVTYVTWQMWLLARWGTLGSTGGKANLSGIPLGSASLLLVRAIRSMVALETFRSAATGLMICGELLFLGVMILVAAIAAPRSAVSPGVKLGWLFYLVLAAFLSGAIWVEDWSFMRGSAEALVLGFMIVIGARDQRLSRIVLAPTLAIWMLLAARTIIAP